MNYNTVNELKYIKTHSSPQYYATFIANNGYTNILDESVSVISDITDNTKDVNLSEWTTINSLFETNIRKYTIDELKEKCKENEIKMSGLKKQDLIEVLISSFTNIWTELKKINVNDLRSIYKTNNITERFALGNTKEFIINNIMNYNSKCSQLLFVKKIKLLNVDDKLSILPIKKSSKCKKYINCDLSEISGGTTISSSEENEEISKDVLCFKINELKKQYEMLEYEERIKQERLDEETRIKKEKLEYEERIKKDEEKKIKKQSEKSKKQFIPKNVKINVWNTHIDSNIQKHKCLCCKKSIITNTDFEVGHVISEKDGGTHEINNLRPICSSCNHSMGTTNMIEYIVKYGYYIS